MFDAVPEPWVGDLNAVPPTIVLGLNPGHAETDAADDWHSNQGAIASEIRMSGTYSAWTAAGPFWHAQWQARNQSYWNARRRFLEGWLGYALPPGGVVGFELYPWHSVAWSTGAYEVDDSLLDDFVFEPAATAGATECFAFGADWFRVLQKLDVDVVQHLSGRAGDWPAATPSRQVVITRHRRLPMHVIAMKHSGSAGPPKPSERDALQKVIQSIIR